MSCNECKYYSELTEPRYFVDHVIYGYCRKGVADGKQEYPVYIPGGKCKDFEKRLENE